MTSCNVYIELCDPERWEWPEAHHFFISLFLFLMILCSVYRVYFYLFIVHMCASIGFSVVFRCITGLMCARLCICLSRGFSFLWHLSTHPTKMMRKEWKKRDVILRIYIEERCTLFLDHIRCVVCTSISCVGLWPAFTISNGNG